MPYFQTKLFQSVNNSYMFNFCLSMLHNLTFIYTFIWQILHSQTLASKDNERQPSTCEPSPTFTTFKPNFNIKHAKSPTYALFASKRLQKVPIWATWTAFWCNFQPQIGFCEFETHNFTFILFINKMLGN